MNLRKNHDENVSLSTYVPATLIPKVENFDEDTRNLDRGAPKYLKKHG